MKISPAHTIEMVSARSISKKHIEPAVSHCNINCRAKHIKRTFANLVCATICELGRLHDYMSHKLIYICRKLFSHRRKTHILNLDFRFCHLFSINCFLIICCIYFFFTPFVVDFKLILLKNESCLHSARSLFVL